MLMPRTHSSTPFLERFADRIESIPFSGCMIYMGPLAPNGYAKVRGHGKPEWIHRLTYKQHVGAIPTGLQVLHRCDIPTCVNPAHLFLGTQKDNIQDMLKKGRNNSKNAPKGIAHHRAKLNDDKVREIRTSPLSAKHFAAKYNVDITLIWLVRSRKIWRHVI